MLSETQAVKQVVERHKRGRTDRVHGVGIDGKTKLLQRSLHMGRITASNHLGWEAVRLMHVLGFWDLGRTAKRLRKRIMKKLRQPCRRKDRGPFRKRASGKNEVTRRR